MAINACRLLQGMELLAFERYMTFKKKGGNHLQFNVLSIPAKRARQARILYEEIASQHSVRLKEVPGPQKVICT